MHTYKQNVFRSARQLSQVAKATNKYFRDNGLNFARKCLRKSYTRTFLKGYCYFKRFLK